MAHILISSIFVIVGSATSNIGIKVIQEFLNDPNWCFLIGSNCYSHSTIWVI